MTGIQRQLAESEAEWQRLERPERIFHFIAGSIILITIAIAAALIFNFAYDMGWIFKSEGFACSTNAPTHCA